MPIKDQLSQLMQSLSALRQTVVRLRDRSPEEARSAIAAVLKRATGSNLELIHALPPEGLVDLVAPPGGRDAEKLLLIAEALRLEASVAPVSPGSYHKAVLLYLAAFEDEDERLVDYADGLAEVLLEAEPAALPTAVARRAFGVLAASGNFALAEDVLFALLEAAPDRVLLEQGRRFYRTLLELDDEVLEGGGLPRAEVEEGLLELGCLASQPSS